MEYVRTLLRVMPKSCKLLRYDYGSGGNRVVSVSSQKSFGETKKKLPNAGVVQNC